MADAGPGIHINKRGTGSFLAFHIVNNILGIPVGPVFERQRLQGYCTLYG